ncbi:hypothetical protein [Ensifer canadensis]|uniref:hypothetical protein n=1 Tax=Ensifer canadensis TaxID=555315 RepID=UPI0035E3BDB0
MISFRFNSMTHWLRIVSLVLASLALVPAGAHLFSLASKMRLSGEDYLAAQRAYDGWNLFAFIVVGAIAALLWLLMALYRAGEPAIPAIAALACIVATQAIFWTFTFPANQATDNWTLLPENWTQLRRGWEYSHAVSAVFNFFAVCLLAIGNAK